MPLRLFAALAVLFLASPALAQTDGDLPGPRECLDDNHANRCDDAVQAEVRALLGVTTIEDEAASGAIVYRAFFVNGYGYDMPAVSFERRPGQSPEVVVHGREGRSMRAPVSRETWERVEGEARFADRTLAPVPPDEDTVSICLHAWVQTVELANVPRSRGADEPVRRRTESACGGGVTTTYAFLLADLAVEAIPPCEHISAYGQRNGVTRLETCLRFSGDRMAALDLHNARLADTRWQYGEGRTLQAVRGQMGVSAHTLVWGDQTIRSTNWDDPAVAEFLFARFEDHPGLTFWPRRVEGLDPRRVTVTGLAEHRLDDDTLVTADYTQTWVFNLNIQQWTLEHWTVGAFSPLSDQP